LAVRVWLCRLLRLASLTVSQHPHTHPTPTYTPPSPCSSPSSSSSPSWLCKQNSTQTNTQTRRGAGSDTSGQSSEGPTDCLPAAAAHLSRSRHCARLFHPTPSLHPLATDGSMAAVCVLVADAWRRATGSGGRRQAWAPNAAARRRGHRLSPPFHTTPAHSIRSDPFAHAPFVDGSLTRMDAAMMRVCVRVRCLLCLFPSASP